MVVSWWNGYKYIEQEYLSGEKPKCPRCIKLKQRIDELEKARTRHFNLPESLFEETEKSD